MTMPPLASSNAHSLPLPPSNPDVSEVVFAASCNASVQISAPCSSRFPDSGERPGHSLDEHQITALKSGHAKTESVKSPARFQENDIVLVYPYHDFNGNFPRFDLKVRLEKLNEKLALHISQDLDEIDLEDLSISSQDLPTEGDKPGWLADFIFSKFPPELTEFINKDWSGKTLFAPEEYQALARFHCAMTMYDDDRGLSYSQDWLDDEFEDFFIKECLPLRDGWTSKEIELVQDMLNYGLDQYMDFKPDFIKPCHYGLLKAGCVSICKSCDYSITENWQTYRHIKNLESQLAKLSQHCHSSIPVKEYAVGQRKISKDIQNQPAEHPGQQQNCAPFDV
ncbi:hypothetical protein [Endozoicomonas acroporae]|uniref:hypothetical protein n=2 Tax=Endozoicomonas acroporae TaxID=1701104 RepID=UPI0013D6FA06|nr:hypothetical protein [Endozoicomonas acroporae]